MRRLLLVALVAPALAEERGVEQILADHALALGAADAVKTLIATGDAGRATFSLPGTWRRDGANGWVEWFRREGAFILGRGVLERYRMDQRTTRGTFYMMMALAEPFPLLAYRDPAKRALLSVGRAEGYEILFTQPDAEGVRTVYMLEAKTHLLEYVRFEIEENRPFATVRFTAHRETKGVMLPHMISARFWNFVEDPPTGKPGLREGARDEHIRGWEIDPLFDGGMFFPPGLGGGGGKGFERIVLPVGPDPYDLAGGDLDGDGACDLAVACEGGVSVVFGGPKGATLFVPLGKGHHHGLAIDDFDGDGRPEVVTASSVEPDRTFFFVAFDAERKPLVRDAYGAPHFTHGLVTDDLDLDGLADVVATGYVSRDVAIRFGNGVSGFRFAGSQWPIAVKDPTGRGLGIATGDLDADGLRDLALANGKRVIVLRGEVNLSFQPRIAIPEEADPKAPWLPVATAFADLDGDGRDDLLIARDHAVETLRDDVIVLRNVATTEPGQFAFVAKGELDMGERVQAVAAAHLDGAPGLDVAATSFLTGELVIASGDGKGGFLGPERFTSGRGACRLAFADWERDGRTDVLVSNRIDDTVSVFLNRREATPPMAPAPPRAVLAKGPVEEVFALEGLSEPYEFAGEFRLPAGIRDPSGIACLGSTPASDQLVVVSDKASALFRLTLDRGAKRLLVGPAIPLRGLEGERLDLEAVAFDDATGNLFLGCEADSTIVRSDLFGRVLGRVKTGIESEGNDGIEAIAFRRRKDNTPLLYVFRERLGTSGKQPPFDVCGLEEDPFALVPREQGTKLPAPLLDQTDAVAAGDRMFVVSRLSREILELRFDGDLFAKEVRRASYRKLTDGLLGLTSPKMPLFGNVEGIAIDWNYDLFLLVDNNGETLGVAGRNQGNEGRLLWFRCRGTAPPREQPNRVRAQRVLVPGGKEAGERARALLARAREGAPLERLAEESALAAPGWITAVAHGVRPKSGEVSFASLSPALGRLLRNLDVGEIELCEYDAAEAPEGWSIVRRVE